MHEFVLNIVVEKMESRIFSIQILIRHLTAEIPLHWFCTSTARLGTKLTKYLSNTGAMFQLYHSHYLSLVKDLPEKKKANLDVDMTTKKNIKREKQYGHNHF